MDNRNAIADQSFVYCVYRNHPVRDELRAIFTCPVDAADFIYEHGVKCYVVANTLGDIPLLDLINA